MTTISDRSHARIAEDERRARAFLNLAEIVRLCHNAASNALHSREIVGLPTRIETIDENTFDVRFSDRKAAVAIERYLTTYLLVDASIIAGRLGALRTVRITLPVLSR